VKLSVPWRQRISLPHARLFIQARPNLLSCVHNDCWINSTDKKTTRQIFPHERIRAYRRPCLLRPTCLTPYNVQDIHNSVSYTIYQGLPQSGSQVKYWARTSLVRLEQVPHSTYYSGSLHAHVADSERRFKMFCKGRSPLTNKQITVVG
jgi:hypothetical protein